MRWTPSMAEYSDFRVIDTIQETAQLFFAQYHVCFFLIKISFVTIVNTPEEEEKKSDFPFNYVLFSLLFILASMLTHLNGVYFKLQAEKRNQERKNDREGVLRAASKEK